MAQLFTVVQRKTLDGTKVYNRGIYTTKKLVWEIWYNEEIVKNPEYSNVQFYDDVNNIYRDPTYSWLCNILTKNGRISLYCGETPIALIVAAEKNSLRKWDVDEHLTLIPNPVVGETETESEKDGE